MIAAAQPAYVEGKAFLKQRALQFVAVPGIEQVLRALRLQELHLGAGAPMVVNTGNSFLIVPVRDGETLAGIVYDPELVTAISIGFGLIGFYVYAPSEQFDATTRMFAPHYGIEEAGTGMAAGTLAAQLPGNAGSK